REEAERGGSVLRAAACRHTCFCSDISADKTHSLSGSQHISPAGKSREKPRGCAGCNGRIRDRFMLQALDRFWHEDCLKCSCCDCRLGRLLGEMYFKCAQTTGLLVALFPLRLFGVTGNCAACSKLIPAFEMVMRARDNVYHLDCFACQLCRQRFCVGDKFFLKNNMILCQLDYEGGHLNGSTERQ
ncbi:hypothetical protein F7725_023264, partial [Dissostichus mawsoni]